MNGSLPCILALHAPGVRADQTSGERSSVTEDRTTAAMPTIDADAAVHYAPNRGDTGMVR